jgi:hypothetical protein
MFKKITMLSMALILATFLSSCGAVLPIEMDINHIGSDHTYTRHPVHNYIDNRTFVGG